MSVANTRNTGIVLHIDTTDHHRPCAMRLRYEIRLLGDCGSSCSIQLSSTVQQATFALTPKTSRCHADPDSTLKQGMTLANDTFHCLVINAGHVCPQICCSWLWRPLWQSGRLAEWQYCQKTLRQQDALCFGLSVHRRIVERTVPVQDRIKTTRWYVFYLTSDNFHLVFGCTRLIILFWVRGYPWMILHIRPQHCWDEW